MNSVIPVRFVPKGGSRSIECANASLPFFQALRITAFRRARAPVRSRFFKPSNCSVPQLAGCLHCYSAPSAYRLLAATPLPFARPNKLRSRRCSTHAPPISRATLRSLACATSSARYPLACHQDPCASPCRTKAGTVQLDRGRVAEWFRSKLYRPEAPHTSLDDSSSLS